MMAVDPPRASIALSRLAATTHPIAEQARALLETLPPHTPLVQPTKAHESS